MSDFDHDRLLAPAALAFFCAAKPREHPAERANTLRIRHALTKVGTIRGGATLPHYKFLECINSDTRSMRSVKGLSNDLSLLLTATRTRRAINPPRKNRAHLHRCR